jgi:hypothetical protein
MSGFGSEHRIKNLKLSQDACNRSYAVGQNCQSKANGNFRGGGKYFCQFWIQVIVTFFPFSLPLLLAVFLVHKNYDTQLKGRMLDQGH